MPIGLVSDEEFNNELSNSSTPSPRVENNTPLTDEPIDPETIAQVIDMKTKGRNGALGVPNIVRRTLADTAIEGASNSEISEAFGVSESSVSAYKQGATSTTTYNNPQKQLKEAVDRKKRFIAGRARNTLNRALTAITEDKLAESDAKSLAGVAKDMSVIIRNMEPPADPTNNNEGRPNIQYIFMAPQPKLESSYEVIEVKE